MQLMPETEARWKVNPNDPADNIRGGMQELRALLDQHNGDVTMALRRYNGSPTAPDTATDPCRAEGARAAAALGCAVCDRDHDACCGTG